MVSPTMLTTSRLPVLTLPSTWLWFISWEFKRTTGTLPGHEGSLDVSERDVSERLPSVSTSFVTFVRC